MPLRRTGLDPRSAGSLAAPYKRGGLFRAAPPPSSNHSYNPEPTGEPGLPIGRPGTAGRAAIRSHRRKIPNDSGFSVASTAHRPSSSAISGLLLKVTPARVPRDLLIRQRLSYDAPDFRDRPAIVAQAPAGFGKTAVLAQWRREHLARGTVVAWLSAQEEDDTQRFVRGLALAVRVASGRPNFGHTLLEGAVPAGLEAVTAWLDDVAQSALDIVMIIDEADRLPPDSREALTYLIHNAPSNLRIIVAARPECDLGVADLVPYGHCAMLGAVSLRFELGNHRAGTQPAQRPYRCRYGCSPARTDRGLAAGSATRAVGDQPQHRCQSRNRVDGRPQWRPARALRRCTARQP